MYLFRNFYYFLLELIQGRRVIKQLIISDFKNKYLTSYLGFSWAFFQPLSAILVVWFAFTYGLKIGLMDNGLPFAIWFIVGMIPWNFANEAISSSTQSLIEYSFLIRKTSFRISIIPIIKIFTALIIHAVFIVILGILCILYGFKPNIYWLQVLYLVPASFVFYSGLGWLLSSLNVFVRDVGQMVSVVLAILFWATPILWPYEMLQGNMKYIALLNPFFYITEGYRYAFLKEAWIFQNVEMTIFFWVNATAFFVIGALVFRKLNPHFADIIK